MGPAPVEPKCYLNHAAQARLSEAVIAAGNGMIQKDPWELHADEDQKRIRELFASIINCANDEVAIVPSTAFATTMAAQNICRLRAPTVSAGVDVDETAHSNHHHHHQQQPKPKQRKILLLQDQYNSAVYGWQRICDEPNSPFVLEIVPHPLGRTKPHGTDTEPVADWTSAVLDRLDETVAVACLPPLHWSDGALLDLDAISERCHSLDIDFVIDGTQAVGIYKVDVGRLRPSLLACSVHKWLRAPAGQCLVYVPRRFHKSWTPLDHHGRSIDHGSEGSNWNTFPDEMGPDGYARKYLKGACKLDSGGKANPLLLPMLRASLEEVALLDVDDAQTKLGMLISPLLDWARRRNIHFPTSHANHLVGLRPPGMTPDRMVAIAKELSTRGVFVAVRCGVFRVSPYLENTNEDIQRLMDELDTLLSPTGMT